MGGVIVRHEWRDIETRSKDREEAQDSVLWGSRRSFRSSGRREQPRAFPVDRSVCVRENHKMVIFNGK